MGETIKMLNQFSRTELLTGIEGVEILDNIVSYIVDAVDIVTAKIELVVRAKKLNIPIISSMGTGKI